MEVTIYDTPKTMKLFLDTADIKAIEDGNSTGLIDGVTTNPSLILKNGGDPEIVTLFKDPAGQHGYF